MKNGFVLTSLVLAAGCSTAVAAEALGVLPSSVSNVLTLSTILGWSTAAGVVAMAWRDYAPAPKRDNRSKWKRVIEAANDAQPAAKSDTSWVYQTLSA